MKKTYISPATDAVEIQSTALLAASTLEMDSTAGNANSAQSIYDIDYEEDF